MSGCARIGKWFWLALLLLLASATGFTQESPPQITQADYDRLTQIFKALEAKYQLQESLLASSKNTIASLQKQLADGQNEISELKILREQLRKEIDERTQSILDLQKLLAESKADSALLSRTLASWEGMLKDLQARWAEVSTSYERALKSWQEFREAAERQIRNLETQRNIAVIVAVAALVFAAVK